MYNLYQSKLRQDIQGMVYKNPHFSISLFWRNYFWLIKEKKIWPVTTQWYQIMWVELPDDEVYIRKELRRLKKEFSTKRNNIHFQLWMLNEIISFENVGHRTPEFIQEMRQMRMNIRHLLCKNYGLKVAFRENMPQANIVYDITKSDEQLMAEMNSWCKERVKKALKKWVYFWIASPDRYDLFYEKRKETVGEKGVNIIPKNMYYDLIRYLTQNNRWNLFISMIDGEIAAWSICLYDEHRIIYLYWFSSRKYGNIWWHHYLKFKIFWWARENWFTYCDMMGWAPTWFPEHPLTSVSLFKESLWGTKIEQYWSYDLVLNPLLYQAFKAYTKLRK